MHVNLYLYVANNLLQLQVTFNVSLSMLNRLPNQDKNGNLFMTNVIVSIYPNVNLTFL